MDRATQLRVQSSVQGSVIPIGWGQARLAPNLPLALSRDAADYGLLFVAPAGKHYVLVNSGLPWWTS